MTGIRMAEFSASGGAGSEGFFLSDGALDDLLSGVDVRRTSVNRPGDGAFPSRSKLDARVFTTGGMCHTKSPADMRHRSSQLKALQAIRESFKVTFDLDNDLTVYGYGFVSDKPTFKPVSWGKVSEWDIELQFDDPTFFGNTRTEIAAVGDTFELHQFGNERSWPVYEIDGNFPNGFTLNGPNGLRFETNLPVTAGNKQTVDMSDGYLRRNGVIVFGRTVRADLWPVPDKGRITQSLTAAGAGTVTGSVIERWN
jgi:hypothetical protein